MAFTDEVLATIIEEIRNEEDYLSKSDSIMKHLTFRYIDETAFDDVAVDSITDQALQFSIIGKVVRKTTFLKPEGPFRPSGSSHPKRGELDALLGTRLRVSLVPPREVANPAALKDDWVRYQSTMARIINGYAELPDGATAFSPYRNDKNSFMLSHLLLSRKLGTTVDEEVDKPMPSGEIGSDPIAEAEEQLSEDDVLKDRLSKLSKITNWPCSAEWHKVADRFDQTHYINPLPAFDDKYELIAPQAYEDKILGAIVHARFSLSRFNIKEDRVFVCNIVELQVLRPPSTEKQTRKKRALADLVLHKKRKRRLL